MVVSRNECVTSASLIYWHVENNKKLEKLYIVTNIEFEAIVSSTKNHFFHQCIILKNKIESNDHKYKTNGTLRYETL